MVPGDAHINTALTNLSVSYLQDLKNYVASRGFPGCPVEKQSDGYFKWNKGDLLRDDAKPRAPGAESAGMDVGLDNTPRYACVVNALHKDVADQTLANAAAPIRPKEAASKHVTQKLIIRAERAFANVAFKAGVWDSNWTGKASAPSTNEFLQWNKSGSDPLANIADAREVVRAATGYEPNRMIVGKDVHNYLRNNSAVLDRIKYTQKGVVTPDLLASLFEVGDYLVAGGVYNSATEGATDAVSSIITDGVLLLYATDSPEIDMPSAGYTFIWKGLTGASGDHGLRIKDFRMEHLEATRVEGEMAFDHKIVCADLGIFLADVLA
jgi:hypothetical protein